MEVIIRQQNLYQPNQRIKKRTRSLKGDSLLAFPNSYVVLDIETTGFSPLDDEIIEIAALKIEEGKTVDNFQSLIKPSVEIGDVITKLTGITNDMVSDAPKIEKVLPSFKSFIGNHILVGHNVNFDINFLYDRFLEVLGCALSNDFMDCLCLARQLLPQLPNHRLGTVGRYFNIDDHGMHRALKDCEVTNQCFNHFQELVRVEFSSADEFTRDSTRLQREYKAMLRKRDAQRRRNRNQDHPFYNRLFVFTGDLEQMSRRRAMQEVENVGGKCAKAITKKTNFLVVGSFEYNSRIQGEKTSKLLKAEKYIEAGNEIIIISEEEFYELLEA